MKKPCPCLSQQCFSDCCEPYIKHQRLPDTPEKLMRSRYSAYNLKLVDYLIDSHHPSKRSNNEKNELLVSIRNTRWLGLIIHKAPKVVDDSGEVEFSAYYKSTEGDGALNPNTDFAQRQIVLPIQQIHERSVFVKEKQQWFYYSGNFLPNHQLSRNDPCFCGSLKKYKRCHGG